MRKEEAYMNGERRKMNKYINGTEMWKRMKNEEPKTAEWLERK